MQITYNIDLLRGGGSLGNSSEVMGLKYERILQPSRGNSIDALGAFTSGTNHRHDPLSHDFLQEIDSDHANPLIVRNVFSFGRCRYYLFFVIDVCISV